MFPWTPTPQLSVPVPNPSLHFLVSVHATYSGRHTPSLSGKLTTSSHTSAEKRGFFPSELLRPVFDITQHRPLEDLLAFWDKWSPNSRVLWELNWWNIQGSWCQPYPNYFLRYCLCPMRSALLLWNFKKTCETFLLGPQISYSFLYFPSLFLCAAFDGFFPPVFLFANSLFSHI